MLTLMAVTLAGEQGCYIYAVATLPRFQGQGLQQMLGEFSIQEMRRRGMKFCCLVPADPGLFSFYSKFGYQADFFRWEKRVTGADIPPGFKPILFGHCGYRTFAALREGYLGRIGRAAAHPEPELRYIYDELCNFQGAVGKALPIHRLNAANQIPGNQLRLKLQRTRRLGPGIVPAAHRAHAAIRRPVAGKTIHAESACHSPVPPRRKPGTRRVLLLFLKICRTFLPQKPAGPLSGSLSFTVYHIV